MGVSGGGLLPVPLPKELKKDDTEVGVMAVELLTDIEGLPLLSRPPPLDIERALFSVVNCWDWWWGEACWLLCSECCCPEEDCSIGEWW